MKSNFTVYHSVNNRFYLQEDRFLILLATISMDEAKLDNGRFEKFKHNLPNCYIVELPWSICPFDWIKDNIENFWTCSFDKNSDVWRFGFETEAEAMHFSLRWK